MPALFLYAKKSYNADFRISTDYCNPTTLCFLQKGQNA